MTETQERKRRRIAMATSLGVHALLVLLLLFMVAWRAPNPPLPEFGIELNFGMDAQGSGDIQPESPVGSEPERPAEQEEEVEELPTPEQQEVTEEEVIEQPAVEETKSVQPEVVAKTESPVVVEEKKEVKPAEKPKEKPVEKVVEPKPEVVKEVPKAVYKPKTESTTQAQTDGKPGTPGSQGDDVNKAGDKGDPQGTLDAKALYGKQGGGGGGVSMSGFGSFGYPDIETPQLPNESNGIYEFKVKVDEQGYVVSVTSVQRGLSIEAERRLKATIQNLQFIPKGNPQAAEGRIIFRVVSE